MSSNKPRTSGNLKQGTLGFSAKRTGSAVLGKDKKQSGTHSAASLRLSKTQSKTPDVQTEPLPTEEEGSLSSVAEGSLASKFTRQKVEKQPNVCAPPELDVDDRKWTTQHRLARQKANAEPIHGENQHKVHEILRVFDLSYEYGPCVGVSRLERWERACALGLNPPIEVRDILSTKQGMEEVALAQSVFHDEV